MRIERKNEVLSTRDGGCDNFATENWPGMNVLFGPGAWQPGRMRLFLEVQSQIISVFDSVHETN